MKVRLHAGVVAEVVILAAGAEIAGEILFRAKRVLPSFAMPELVHHQDKAPRAGPQNAHLLKSRALRRQDGDGWVANQDDTRLVASRASGQHALKIQPS